MGRPQQGWTHKVASIRVDLLDKAVWMGGPFGRRYRLEEYDFALLFASGDGIFAQLPLMKSLVARTARTKIKLVWWTDDLHLHTQLGEWIQTILEDDKPRKVSK